MDNKKCQGHLLCGHMWNCGLYVKHSDHKPDNKYIEPSVPQPGVCEDLKPTKEKL